MTLSDTTKGVLVWAVIFLLGGASGWFLKGERTIIQVQKTLDKEHTAAVNLEVKHDARKQEDELRIRIAGTVARDCDRERGNAEILDRLTHH